VLDVARECHIAWPGRGCLAENFYSWDMVYPCDFTTDEPGWRSIQLPAVSQHVYVSYMPHWAQGTFYNQGLARHGAWAGEFCRIRIEDG